MAFRDDKFAPWTIAVVRRLNRVTGALVELGVEYLGHDPQACVLAAAAPPPRARRRKRAATASPDLPSAERGESRGGRSRRCCCRVRVRAGRTPRSSPHGRDRHRLKTALERDTDYVWTTFEPLAVA
jgi:hypothetical protein